MKVCLISGPALNYRHGTGAQILRNFEPFLEQCFHVYWNEAAFGTSEFDKSFLLKDQSDWILDWTNKLPKGQRFARKLIKSAGILWWNDGELSRRKFDGLLSSNRLSCDVAYVVVVDEVEAYRASSILEYLGCPYVVHIMDVITRNGLNPAEMPQLKNLLIKAESVLSLNLVIESEVLKFSPKASEVVAFGQKDVIPASFSGSERFQVIVSGNIDKESSSLYVLARALERIKHMGLDLQFIYTGNRYKDFPSSLQTYVEDAGYVTVEQYRELVSRSHAAFLPGPTNQEAFARARYSIQSRVADYLLAGLPILAWVERGSATELFLSSLSPTAVRFVNSTDDIVQGLLHYFDPKQWSDGSAVARAFAYERLRTTVVREKIIKHLRQALGGN